MPKYGLSWTSAEAFDEVIVSARMVSDHMPDAVLKVLSKVAEETAAHHHPVQVDNIV